MSVSDSLLPLRMTEASIEGQEVQHIPLTGFALCGLEKWGFRRYAPTSPVPRREGSYNQSLSAPLTSAFAFLWACEQAHAHESKKPELFEFKLWLR